MFNKLRRVASEAPTLLPASMSFKSVVISMVPRAILVGTPRAWKKEVFPGSIPLPCVNCLSDVYAQSMLLRVSGGNVDIAGSDGTGTSGGSDTVGEDLV